MQAQETRSDRIAIVALVVVLLTIAALSAVSPVNGARAAQATVVATAAGTQEPLFEIPTPECTAPAKSIVQMTEGPYYTANTPERQSLLEPGIPGVQIIVTGYVLDTECKPIANAWLEFWQTDGYGVYDNVGYKMRGHQFTDENGRYYLETVIPGEYPGRTNHIHVKVQAPNGQVVTSQLFFPGAEQNDTDRIFDQSLLVIPFDRVTGMIATASAAGTVPTAVGTVDADQLPVYLFNFVVTR
jgi:protocatechuate 3,4-dioxygenase beta subunit